MGTWPFFAALKLVCLKDCRWPLKAPLLLTPPRDVLVRVLPSASQGDGIR